MKDWAEALEPMALNAKRAESAREDLERLDTLIAEEYFRKTKTVLQAWDSDALYFGPRFSGRYTPEVVEVASRYCDAICFNIYEYEPDARTADDLADEYDVPVVIGEFHFGSLDRGMFHTGLKKATDQADRAEKYAHYIETAAKAPWCVGAHWFQYKDQALTGRGDGENYNIGFVNVADAPYPALIGAARDVHERLYPLRAGQ